MDECQISVKVRVEKVSVVLPQLIGIEQSLVDNGERRQGANVEATTRLGDFVGCTFS